MTATRIRSTTSVKITGSGGGGGTNPPGSSLTTDDIGAIEIMLAEAAAATPTENNTFAIAFSNAEAAAGTPTEAAALDITTAATDTAATPTGAHSAQVNAGATSVTQTTGTGWTNPGSAQSNPDLTYATCTGASGVTPATVSGTLTGTYAAVTTASGVESISGSMVLTFYGSLNVPALGTGSLQLQYSVDNGANYVTVATYSSAGAVAAYASPTSTQATIAGFTLGGLASLRFRAVASCLGSAVANTVAQMDAVVAVFTTTGNNAG